MTAVPLKTGSERVGTMKSSRPAVVIVNPILGKSAMYHASGRSVGTSATGIALGSGVEVGGVFDIRAESASGRLGASAERTVSMRIER